MNVGALQKHLNDVAALAAAAGASPKVSNELLACAQALAPFASRPVSELAVFLGRATDAAPEGPVPWASAKKPRAAKATVPPKPSPDETIDRLHRLYESIAHTTLDDEGIEKELGLIGTLKGKAIDGAAEKMNVLAAVKKAKGVDAKKAIIRGAILNRRGRFERNDY